MKPSARIRFSWQTITARTSRASIRDLSLPANPSLYIHAPARLDPSMAPPGQDTLTAIVPVGHLSENGEQDWGELRDEARQHVFRRLRTLGITDLEAHIKFEETYTPLSWRKRYNLVKGSTHGLSHTLTQMAYFRPSNRHPRYQNLYFVGASTHPGTGMPTAMVSGRLAAERIMDEISSRSILTRDTLFPEDSRTTVPLDRPDPRSEMQTRSRLQSAER